MFRETESSVDVDGLRAQVQLLQKEKALLQEALVEGATEGGGDTGGSGVVPPRPEVDTMAQTGQLQAPAAAGSGASGSGARRLMVPTPTIETPRMADTKTDTESYRPRSPLTPLFDGPTSGVRGSSWCCAAAASRPLATCSRSGAASPKEALPVELAPQLPDGGGMEHEEIATGVLARARRTADTLLIGTKLHFSVKALEKEMDKKKDADDDEVRERWDELHKKNADMVFRHIMKYRGFFIKAGQKASTMAGVLPDPWVQALTPLQDCIPITAFPSVQKTVLEDLGKPLEEIFCEFEQTPIASASIGQAHVARLRQDGLKVCVKIEHPGIAELASVDLDNLEVLIKWLGTHHPNAPDFSEVVKEMRRSSLEEVDFRLEAKNAQEALRALQEAGSRVGCPEPFTQYCGPHVLTMRFIEGWKITETERLPPNTDREGMAAEIVEAFATLVFKEGLIHGDPHPGNIFVEQGPSTVRPILLDWGIVKRVTPEERNTLAKWVVASLSRDRFLYLATLGEMGISLAQGEIDHSSLDMFMFTGMLQLRDTMPTNAKRQFHEQFSKQAELEKGKKDKKLEKSGKKLQKLIEKIPGWIHFFFRGLNMLQDVCGMLDVTVPVAKLMLRHALPVLGCTSSPGVPLLPKVRERSPLERLILAKLEELGTNVGGQVAVLAGESGLPGEWRCNLAFGRMGPAGAPLSEESLLPALDVGLSVLQSCLLAALSRPTVTGKEITLDTPVERLWPEFSRGGKGGITIREMLQYQGGLARPFKGKTNFKTFINEQQMEEMIAAAPRSAAGPGAGGPCAVRPVVGAAVASLLRRALGKKTACEALRAALQPLGLHDHIVYKGGEERMARVGHRLLEEVTMATIWEILEERMERETGEEKKLPPWLDWREFSAEQPWCVDPLLVNCKELREGRGCCTGRGLRATAQALCRLLSSGAVPAALLDRSRGQARRIEVESLEEWEEHGRCLDVSAGGWQLLKFRRVEGGEEVLAHGQVDGATGSLALRLPRVSIAVMLTCSDKDTRHVGRELLLVVASELGLEPVWHVDVPKVPERVPRGQSPLGPRGGASGGDSKEGRIESAISRLEGQVARLTEALATQGGPGLMLAAPASHPLEGAWKSAETLGLEELLDALDVPAMARVLAKKMQRTLRFEVRGDSITIDSTTSVAGRTVEETTTTFEVGKPFSATMFTKPCTGTARWEDGAAESADPEGRTLVVQKVIEVGRHSVTIEERAEVTPEGRLAWQTIVKGPGDVVVELQREADREQISRNLDKKSRRLTKEVALSNGKQVLRGGVLATVKGKEVKDKAALAAMELPGSVSLFYGNFQSTMLFDLEGGPKARPRAAAKGVAPSKAASSRSLVPEPRRQGRAVRAVKKGSGCCSGLCMARQALSHLLAARLRAVARWLEGGSSVAAAPRHPSQHVLGRAGSSASMEGFQDGRGGLRSQSSQGSAPQALERSFQEAMTLTRQISNSTFGDTENGTEHS